MTIELAMLVYNIQFNMINLSVLTCRLFWIKKIIIIKENVQVHQGNEFYTHVKHT